MRIVDYLKKSFTNSESKLNIIEDNKMMQEAKYVPKKSAILINEKLIITSANDKGIYIKEYATIIFLHELGHILDEELEQIDREMNEALMKIYDKGFSEEWFNVYAKNSYKAEENAWKIAETLVAKEYLSNFFKIKKESLELHENILKDEKKLLKLDNRTSIIFNK